MTTYKLIFTESFERRATKFFTKHPDLLSLYEKKLVLLSLNPRHPSLRLHKLSGKIGEFYSVSINMRYRIILEFRAEHIEILLIDIGTHDEVYR